MGDATRSILQTSTVTSVAVDTTVGGTALAAKNPDRRIFAIQAPTGAPTLYVSLAATAATAPCTVILQAGDYWELPTFGDEIWIGQVTGITATGSGTWYVTELSR